MASRYGFGSVDVGVEARKVHLLDLFVSLATVVQFGCVGSTAVQGMTRVQRVDHMIMFEIILHIFVLLQFPVDVAFPHFYNIVDLTFQILDLRHGAVVKLLHGFAIDRIHCIAGVTSRTSVPEKAVIFIRRMSFFVVAVKRIVTFAFLAIVTCVFDIDFILIGRVRQPFVRKQRLVISISPWWNDGDRIFRKVIGAIHEMAGRGDGERPERIDVGDIVKQFAKLHTTPSENINVGTTVRRISSLKLKT